MVVGQVASAGVDPAPRSPALGAVSVGAQEVDLESSGPGILVRVSQLVRKLQLNIIAKINIIVLSKFSSKSR